MPTSMTLVVHFNDGTRLSCAFPRQADNAMGVLRNVRRALESDKLALEADGQLLLVPTSNVKYICVSPSPEPLPEGIIRGATLVD